MHEYSIASRIVEIIEKTIMEEDNVKVKEAHLNKGELRILSEKALKSAYQILTENTSLEGSDLVIQEIKTAVKCRKCGYQGKVPYYKDIEYHFQVPILECPKCKSPAEIKAGKELDLVQLVVEESDGSKENNH